MIDTLKLKSPPLPVEALDAIMRRLDRTQKTRLETGEILYQIHAGQVPGGYDYRISARIDIDKVVLEGTSAKLRQGHNVLGHSESIPREAAYMIATTGHLLGADLGTPEDWTISRLDIAESYILPSHAAAVDYITRLRYCRYPRRKVNYYTGQSIFVPGRRFALKIYHKGAEYRRHDYHRALEHRGREYAEHVATVADRVVRTEISIRSMHIRHLWGRKVQLRSGEVTYSPRIGDIPPEAAHHLLDAQIRILLAEGDTDMREVSTRAEVLARLTAVYGERKGRRLADYWYCLATEGVEVSGKGRHASTTRRHLADLRAAGVAWTTADVAATPAGASILADFKPLRRDKHRYKEGDTHEICKVGT